MPTETNPVTPESKDYEVRNAAIGVCQRMPEGLDRNTIEELFERFNNYIEVPTGGIPRPRGRGTDHQERIAKLSIAVDFFQVMSHSLSTLGLIADWGQPTQEMAKGVRDRVTEDRVKYRRAISLITEIYTVHLVGNGALFSIDALPDEIRTEVRRELKSRKLLRDD